MVKTIGTSLLAVGFLMLAGAVLITDPTALDANIGAGALTYFGLPVGTLGLVVLVVGVILGWSRGRRRR